MPDARYRMQEAGYQTQDAIHAMSHVGYGMPDAHIVFELVEDFDLRF